MGGLGSQGSLPVYQGLTLDPVLILKLCGLELHLLGTLKMCRNPGDSIWTHRQLDRPPVSSRSGVTPGRGKLTSPCTPSSLQALLGLLVVT